MRALVFGSLNIDYVYQVEHFVQRGETLASASMQRFCGGKGLNQAVALSRAGMETWMAGAIGRDGVFLTEELQRAGVDTRLIARTDKPTGHAIIQNSPDGDNCILLFGGANRCVTERDASSVLGNFDRGDLLLVQNEISSLPAIMRLGKERGLRTALNPSPMESELIRAALPYADILLLNRIEAAQLLDSDAGEPEETLKLLQGRFGCPEIVLTLGGDGAVLLINGEILQQKAYPAEVKDTTAAGDTFTGFYLAGMQQWEDAAQALRFAAAAAALAVTRPGASPSIPTKEETLEFMRSHCKD